jgi:membrane protease YdiL (CAAX protease family)
MKRQSLAAYFLLAFVGTWVTIVPLLLSQRGFGLLVLPDPVLLLVFFLATYTGPFAAALVVTRVTTGKAGLRQLLRSIVQWRVGLQWYLLVLFGYPLLFAIGISVAAGGAIWSEMAQQWPLFFSLYLPNILVGLFLPSLGEETGWRGFALPRLQRQYGPLFGSLILGTLHGLWHIPAYFVRGMILPDGFDGTVFVANTLAIIAVTFIWTWLVNHARGSVLMAIFIHATSNAAGAYIQQLVPGPGSPWFTFVLASIVALILIVLTRGRLGYQPERAPVLAAESA